jgi:hypothetical protein
MRGIRVLPKARNNVVTKIGTRNTVRNVQSGREDDSAARITLTETGANVGGNERTSFN